MSVQGGRMIPRGHGWFGVLAMGVGAILALACVVFFLAASRTPRGRLDPVPDDPPQEEDEHTGSGTH